MPKCSANINDLTGNKVDVLLQNLGGNSIRVVSVTIDWPISNEELKEVEMGGTTIWSGPINSSPYTIDQWSGDPGAREINPSGSRTMRFTFKRDAASNGYRIAVSFDNGCKVTARR